MKHLIAIALLFAFVQTLEAADIADGFYLRSEDAAAPVVKLQDGWKLRPDWVPHLGEKADVTVYKSVLYSLNNANTSFYLVATIPVEQNRDQLDYLLAIGGTVYRQSGSGSSTREALWTVDFGIEGEEEAKQVARFFGIAPIYRRHPQHQLLVVFAPAKKEYVLGEPIDAILEIKNVGTNTVCFQQGGWFFGRDEQYSFSARYWAQPIKEIGIGLVEGGGFSQRRILKGGETFKDTIGLDQWFSFDKAGGYLIHGSYRLYFFEPNVDRYQVIWEDYATGDFNVNVRQPTKPPDVNGSK